MIEIYTFLAAGCLWGLKGVLWTAVVLIVLAFLSSCWEE
jgi:hypothetical protein